MTTTSTEAELVECACGCGELTKPSTRSRDGKSWKRGHYLRSQAGKLTALPGPDDDLDDADDVGEDLGEIPVPGGAADSDGPVPPDRPPGRLRERPSGEPRGRSKTRVTPTMRKDIHAKIAFVLVPMTQVWQVRDPVCGAVAVSQEPAITDALADIVCDSADLVAFFTGPAGGFMKYLKLAFALQPVVMTAWLHHIAHQQFVPAGPPADYREYAA